MRITFTNELPVATTIHWHGIDVPNALDGVPGLTPRARGSSTAMNCTMLTEVWRPWYNSDTI